MFLSFDRAIKDFFSFKERKITRSKSNAIFVMPHTAAMQYHQAYEPFFLIYFTLCLITITRFSFFLACKTVLKCF